jgi:hypothetical protein
MASGPPHLLEHSDVQVLYRVLQQISQRIAEQARTRQRFGGNVVGYAIE